MKVKKHIGLFFVLLFTIIELATAKNFINRLEPRDGAIVDNNVVFRWSPFGLTGSYQVQIARDNEFSTLVLDTVISSTAFSRTINSANALFYWRIRVKANNFATEWTDPSQFSILNIKNINSLSLWYSSKTLATNVGSGLNSWPDLSNNANNGLQATVSKQPLVASGGTLLNNNKVVRFDGTDDFMAFSKLNNIRTMFFLLKHRTGSQSTYPPVLGDDVTYNFHGSDGSLLFLNGAASTNIMNGVGYVNNTLTSPPAMRRYTDYSVLSFATVGNVTASYITNDRNAGRFWDGDYAEIILFNDTLPSVQFENIRRYLYAKYVPPVSIRDTIVGNSFCTPVTIQAPGIYSNYLWSSGATTATTTLTPNNTYFVRTRDVFGNENTAYFNVYPYNRLGGVTLYACQNDTIKVPLNLPAGFTTLWNTGLNSNEIKITQSGQYTVKITDGSGCFVYDTVNVVIDNPYIYPVPNNSNIISLCRNEKLFISSITSFDTIHWSTGSNDNYLTATTPGQYSVFAKTTTGCVLNKSFSIDIAGDAPVAKFVFSPVCQSSDITFSDSSVIPAGNSIQTWKWTFSNGTTSSIQNPSNIFSNLGVASAALKVVTNAGCSDSTYKTFVVNKRPVPAFYNLLSCSGNPTTFVDQTLPNAASVVDWSWNFGGLGTINHIQNPSFSFPTSGYYNVTLRAINSNGCIDTVTLQTLVNTSPVSSFSYDSVCGATPVTFKFLASVAPPNTIPDINWGSWDFGDGTIETAIRNPQHVYPAPGTYDVMLIVKSSGQCVDTAFRRIRVFDYPAVDFIVSQTQCVGKEIQFTDISSTPDATPVTKWNWYFSGLATDTLQNPRYTFNTQGNYTIQLTAKNEAGCAGTKLRSIAVTAPPTPRFTFTPQNGLPPLNVVYTNQSPASGNYIWNYGDGSPLIQAYNPPQHVYTTIGSYPIKLIATDFRGCTDTLTKYILVDKAYLDGVMASISIIPDGDFYRIQATIINNSNIEITSMGLSLQLGGGAVIRENWSGSLLPGQTTVYVFTGEIKVGENNQIPVVCASIDNINNNMREDRTDNNTTCKEVAVGSFSILNIYPSPANENINFGVMLPKEGKVNIRFVSVLGQIMYNKDFDGTKGYNQLTMPVSLLNATVYIAEISFDGQTERKKFMVKNTK